MDYKINSISKEKDSIGEVFVKVRNEESFVQGRAINVDIIVASANAYIDTINRLKVTGRKYLKIKQ
ncbi:alpha-isopropylmalate synthase regulatory domain-containing protein [Cytobacillus sp. Hz8]|uniref:alpha-isopropylmalate synthase regulatory domain-containing protein n=1 Tax=Cytobacillus sp. Hz8 TaxID=3347168 RepID=UPI0035D9FC7D